MKLKTNSYPFSIEQKGDNIKIFGLLENSPEFSPITISAPDARQLATEILNTLDRSAQTSITIDDLNANEEMSEEAVLRNRYGKKLAKKTEKILSDIIDENVSVISQITDNRITLNFTHEGQKILSEDVTEYFNEYSDSGSSVKESAKIFLSYMRVNGANIISNAITHAKQRTQDNIESRETLPSPQTQSIDTSANQANHKDLDKIIDLVEAMPDNLSESQFINKFKSIIKKVFKEADPYEVKGDHPYIRIDENIPTPLFIEDYYAVYKTSRNSDLEQTSEDKEPEDKEME